tara:strand:- start:113 stop:562 length:450 start_codon:yes stop_codon:yes gene_type:complete
VRILLALLERPHTVSELQRLCDGASDKTIYRALTAIEQAGVSLERGRGRPTVSITDTARAELAQLITPTQETTMTTYTDILSSCRCFCIDSAIEQGWDGEPDDYETTAGDMEWITEQFQRQVGRKPTAEEWRAAGMWYPGMADAYFDVP